MAPKSAPHCDRRSAAIFTRFNSSSSRIAIGSTGEDAPPRDSFPPPLHLCADPGTPGITLKRSHARTFTRLACMDHLPGRSATTPRPTEPSRPVGGGGCGWSPRARLLTSREEQEEGHALGDDGEHDRGAISGFREAEEARALADEEKYGDPAAIAKEMLANTAMAGRVRVTPGWMRPAIAPGSRALLPDGRAEARRRAGRTSAARPRRRSALGEPSKHTTGPGCPSREKGGVTPRHSTSVSPPLRGRNLIGA